MDPAQEQAEFKSLFERLIQSFAGQKVAIVTHNKADVDAYSSAFALHKFIPNSVMCSGEEMNEGAKKLSAKFNIIPIPLSSLLKTKETYAGVIVCDTSAHTLAPDVKSGGWKILGIIDHHRKDGKDMLGEIEIIDEQSPSAAEIIAGLLGHNIDSQSAFALSVGIIADGARFKSARKETFATLNRLMEICGTKYIELLEYAEPERTEESKTAILRAFKKIEYQYSEGYFIVKTETTSNEGDVAGLLSEVADVAFVARWKNEDKVTRVSARASKKVKIPLNEVMAEIGRKLGGAGGGHPKAAGVSVPTRTEETLQECVDLFIEKAHAIE